MKVSVIVPVYNHSRYLHQRLDSIINQTYKDYELIILDDASTDNSREIILEYAEKYPGIITCFNEQNSGSPFKQWNKGVSLSHGEYIWIAESDDFAERAFLKSTIDSFVKYENIGMIYCDSRVLNEVKGIEYLFSQRTKYSGNCLRKIKLRSLVEYPIPNVSSVLFLREAFIKSGGGDESMKFSGDWALYLKICRFWTILYLPEPLNTYRLHNGSHYHKYYKSNILILERLRIFSFLIKIEGISLIIMLQMARWILKSIILRSMNLMRLPDYLIPEIPRRPQKVKYLS